MGKKHSSKDAYKSVPKHAKEEVDVFNPFDALPRELLYEILDRTPLKAILKLRGVRFRFISICWLLHCILY